MFGEITKAFVLKNLPESEVEFVGEVPYSAVLPYREKALKHIAEHLELPGFRPGKVPADIALKKVGELTVLEEAVELFVKDFYIELTEAHNIEAVGRPDIRVTKLAAGNPVGLSVRATVYPEVALPKNWRRLHEIVPLEPYMGELPKMKVPPSAEEEQKAREYLARDKRRGKLIEALLEKSTLSVPRIFIESELEKILSQMREDVKRFGMEFEEYLKKTNKTEGNIRNEFSSQARKRAQLRLLLNKIAAEEKLVADGEAVKAEIKHALEHFPDANPELLRIHIETVLKNELALKFLEGETK